MMYGLFFVGALFVGVGLCALGDWLHGMYERGGPWKPWP